MIAEATIREALTEPPPAGSLFEACVEAVLMAPKHEHIGIDIADQVTRAVIQTIIDRTESPTTCAELTRILAGVV